MAIDLPKHATFKDLRSSPTEKVRFARRVLGVFSKARKDHGDVVVRMGITGTGVEPNYRVEAIDGRPLFAVNGANHEQWPAGESFEAPDNWSSVTMSYEDVQAVVAAGTTRA